MVDYRLYFVLDTELTGGHELENLAHMALRGGVSLLQLRCKECSSREFLQLARRISHICREYTVPFVVNDRVEIAQAIGADGVHLGQDDLPCSEARRILKKSSLIGISTETGSQARQAESEGADYIAVQPVFATNSKTDLSDPIGAEGLASFSAIVSIPIVAIGGIKESNAAICRDQGIDGIAVISAISLASDPQTAAANLKRIMQGENL